MAIIIYTFPQREIRCVLLHLAVQQLTAPLVGGWSEEKGFIKAYSIIIYVLHISKFPFCRNRMQSCAGNVENSSTHLIKSFWSTYSTPPLPPPQPYSPCGPNSSPIYTSVGAFLKVQIEFPLLCVPAIRLGNQQHPLIRHKCFGVP